MAKNSPPWRVSFSEVPGNNLVYVRYPFDIPVQYNSILVHGTYRETS
jgi:nitroimidazol reductase NimA-like FMN-containing flavoprotein (pyridoxamine 5'-phosphate oxidase superfamily)